MSGYLAHFGLKKAKTPFADVVPPLSEEQAAALKENIKLAGKVEKPIIVDSEGNILDGHHRQRFEPDCRFVINDELTSDAQKQAFVFKCAYLGDGRKWTKRQGENQLRSKKQLAMDLLEEGLLQRDVAARLGTCQTTISNWKRKPQKGNVSNINGNNAKHPDNRRKLSDADKEAIGSRIDEGEKQVTIAADYDIAPSRISQIAKQRKDGKPSPPPARSAQTISEHARAARQEVAKGTSAVEASGRHGFTNASAYGAAARVAECDSPVLIDAMNREVLTVRQAGRLVNATSDDIDAAIEKAELKVVAKNHKLCSTKGKTRPQRLMDMLDRTWVEWKGFAGNGKITSKTIPTNPDKLADMQRLCRTVRDAVNTLLDQIEKEATECSKKTAERKRS